MTRPNDAPRPRRNRVAPDGGLIATPSRGLYFGNRGRLHDASGETPPGDRLRWSGRRWIICLTRYKDWRRPLAPPGGYTGLFFLDEATALAAGHRPCALCRRAAYDDFRARAGLPGIPADALDRRLHAERLQPDWRQAADRRRTHPVAWPDIPAGALVALPEGWFLALTDRLLPWRPEGYGAGRPRPTAGVARSLTPPTALAALAAGYPVTPHPTTVG